MCEHIYRAAAAGLLSIGCISAKGDPDTARHTDRARGTETAAEDTDTGLDPWDTDPVELLPVEDGFERELGDWHVSFDEFWGARWSLEGVNAAGDTVFVAGQLVDYDTPNVSILKDLTDTEDPVHVVIDHWPGAVCILDCDPCDSYGPLGYRAVSGQIELSLWEEYADVRFTDVLFAPEFDGEEVLVPLIEVTGIPYRVCEYDEPWG